MGREDIAPLSWALFGYGGVRLLMIAKLAGAVGQDVEKRLA
jgi:hypothetical protein